MKKEIFLKKLVSLRTRIEKWCEKNGYENMGNVAERKNSDGTVVWRRSDWEFVDDMHNLIYNDEPYFYTKDTYKDLNTMWNKYKLENLTKFEFKQDIWDSVTIVKPNA